MNFFKKNIDTETAEGIFNKLLILDKLDIQSKVSPFTGTTENYRFILDDFDIKVMPSDDDGIFMATHYIEVDGIRLKCGHGISRKIYKRMRYILETPGRENKEFIRKDANINFKKYR